MLGRADGSTVAFAIRSASWASWTAAAVRCSQHRSCPSRHLEATDIGKRVLEAVAANAATRA